MDDRESCGRADVPGSQALAPRGTRRTAVASRDGVGTLQVGSCLRALEVTAGLVLVVLASLKVLGGFAPTPWVSVPIAVAESAVAVSLFGGVGRLVRVYGTVALGLGFSIWTIVLGPSGATAPACACFGAQPLPYAWHLGIAIGVFSLGGLVGMGHLTSDPRSSCEANVGG